jgi:ligand-binding SRPBCC domain-containing protein
MYYELTDAFEVPATPDQVWQFFSTAENLAKITPPWLGFTARDPFPVRIEQDALLNHTVKWLGIPIKWQSKIIHWSPPHEFIDLQLRGPYTLWHHQHTFTPTPTKTVRCADRVIYKLPLGPLGRFAHALTVKRQLREIFHHRRKAIAQHLGWTRALQDDITIRPLT